MAWLVLAVLAALYVQLVWKFDWLCDDSFISFRYARNLGDGYGLVYNPGESPRVEGYTNLLWVLWLAPFEMLGPRLPMVARISSLVCGLVLFIAVARFLFARTQDRRAAVCAMAFLATLPPFAAWTTSGLETMPFTLALFGTFASLFAAKPSGVRTALCAIATLLLRADGFVFVGMLLAIALAGAWRTRSRELARAALQAGVAMGVVFAAHMLWRHAYYDAWEPNTARVKVEPGIASLTNGWAYVMTFVLNYPAVPIAFAIALVPLRKTRDLAAVSALVAVLGVFGYVLFVGGDFMAMGRFLVPSLPLLTVALASSLAQLFKSAAGALTSFALTAACAALSLGAAYGYNLVPVDVRQRFRFRWNMDEWLSEYDQWGMMKTQAAKWRLLGRALGAKTQPGDSLVVGTIGAVGYFSHLIIYDPYGLVSREEFEPMKPDVLRSPGHQRRIALSTFLKHDPTYIEAGLVERTDLFEKMRPEVAPGGTYASVAAPEWVDIQDVPGVAPTQVLRLVRYRH